MVRFIWDEFEIVVDDSTVSRALKCLGWNRTKITKQAAQRCKALRDDWMICLDGWTAEQLVFLDESAVCERTGKRLS